MIIKVEDKLLSMDTLENHTVADLKVKIAEELDVSVEDFYLTTQSNPLTDEASLGDVNIVNVMFRLFGGKVHGSLARAGKVRGQTPKVDKTEKKKSRTGRAKRRMQYNRRFVNVVPQGPGRRRGPNSNS